jgi:hypothetical protein
MEYFRVTFESHATFQQMKMHESSQFNEVEILCQYDDWVDDKNEKENEKVKEIIFSLPTPENYNYEIAQFSISKKEAELLVKIFKFHFDI